MIEFNYKVTKKGFIEWDATWDGKHDNDPLISKSRYEEDSESILHPFSSCHGFIDDYRNFKSKRIPGTFAHKMIHEKLTGTMHAAFGDLDYDDHFSDPYTNDKWKQIGEIVVKNSVTLAICKLLSDPDKLTKESGNSDPYCYISNLFAALDMLWD